MTRYDSLIGEIKGKIEILVDEVLPRIEGKISKMEEGLNNHLAHHDKRDERRTERWFKVGMIIFQIILSGMLSYLLLKK
jgi:hypothetical protein